MANRKLSIGCVLIMGSALTNCGGTVEPRSDGGEEQGGSGFVGVPPNGGFTGAVGIPVGAGAAPYGGSTGIGGYVGTCCPGAGSGPYGGAGAGGTYVGTGGLPGTVSVGGGAGGYGNESGWAGEGAVGVPPWAGEPSVAGAGGEPTDGSGGNDG